MLAMGGLALGVCSCAKKEKRAPVFAVNGQLVDGGGKPLPSATVVFHPVADPGPDVPKPRGTTDENGSFRLTTYDGNDGAPEGEYLITVERWITPSADQGPVNKVAAKYAKPETSGLKATVAARPTDLEPFVVN
jgi:hypothetical protein